MKRNVMECLKKERFIAILRHIEPQYAVQAVEALYRGGVRFFEVTFNPGSETTITDTQKMIGDIRHAFGDTVYVGAGTVLTKSYAQAAYEAGASFIVSPCTDKRVIDYTKKKGMLSVPGAYTPTEIMTACQYGADIVKIFPVAPDEIGYLKNVSVPLSHIPFIPTGGINPDTIEAFLDTGAVAVAAGASLVTNAMAAQGDYPLITENARNHIDKVRKYKTGLYV